MMKAQPSCACLAVLLGVVLGCLTLRAGAPEGASEGILQQELKQQQLQRTIQRVAEQLAMVIAEFENNGISGDDLRTLKAIRAVLGRLGEKEMHQVIALLGQARAVEDPAASRERLAGAYTGQKTIVTLLKQLLLEYERQQALYELSIRFREMAARQGKNMRAGVWMLRNGAPQQLNEDQKVAVQVQELDQVHLKDETAILVGRLEKLAAESDGAAVGERPKAAAGRVHEGGLVAALDAAIADLKARKLTSAASREKVARDELRAVARLLLMSKDAADLLRAAIAETEATISLQKQIIEEARGIEKRDDGLLVDDHEFEVHDATDLIRHDVQDIAPAATVHLRAAFDRMQDARQLLVSWDGPEKKRRDVPARLTEAVGNLELARRALQEQLAKAEAEASQHENPLDRLKDLQKQVQDLARRQEELRQETARSGAKPQDLRAHAPEQGDLKDKTQDAQQKAAEEAPAAARALNDAATAMDQAQKTLARSQNAERNQQAALDSLAKAGEEIGREVARLEETSRQVAALEKLSDKVGDLIKKQEKVNLETGREAAQPAAAAAVAKDLARKEHDLAKEGSRSQQEAGRLAPAAAPHLGEAAARMNEAGDQLDKPAAGQAQAPERKALAELFAAKQQIDRQMDGLKQELGLQDGPGSQSTADAAAAIEKAQKEVDRAISELGDAPPGQRDPLTKDQGESPPAAQKAAPVAGMDAAAQELGQAAQDITPVAAGELGDIPPVAQAAVESALHSLNDAAGQAAGHQQTPARANAAAAAQALAQAQAALTLAEAGLSGDMAKADQADQQGQQPGQGKSPAQGKQPGPGKQPGRQPSPQATGKAGNWNGQGGANGPLKSASGSGEFVRLPSRDRAAIQQSRSENYPQEYGPLVEQYLKNLSDQAGQK
jgi:hypothetical protein